ncbi:MAG: hypothetical protein MJ240_10420 [Kiritimatiellae bacterium]|nr:hypothetical protein [Kiritimatiellia bacterium]
MVDSRFARVHHVVCLVGALFLMAGTARAATTWHVGGPAASDDNDGTGAAPFATIQKGIDSAGKNDTVLIAAGTYLIDESVSFNGKSIELKGATGNPADVVIDGQGKCPCLVNLAYEDTLPQVIVSSLTVSNGFSSTSDKIAGGITSHNMALVTNCVVRDCHHSVRGKPCYGGGVYLADALSDPTRLASNWPAARAFRATIADVLVEDCSVTVADDGDTARNARGGGIYAIGFNSEGVTVRRCTAVNNTSATGVATTQGGGACLTYGTHTNGVFVGNRLENPASLTGYLGTGGGVYVSGGYGRGAVLVDALIEGNSTHGAGGGVGLGSYATLSACTVISNSIAHLGPKGHGLYQPGGVGVYITDNHATLANCLVAGNVGVTNAANNSTSAGAVGVYNAVGVTIRDCVIRDNLLENAGALSCISAGGLLVTNCVMCGNCASGEVSAVRFYTNQSEYENAAPSLIADCFIVSNSLRRVATLTNGGGTLYYSGNTAGKDGYYAAPLTVRNCLFAGNRARNGCRGWIVRVHVNEKAVAYDGKEEALAFDHCTFVTNFNENEYPHVAAYSERGARNTRFQGCLFSGNLSRNGANLAKFYSTYPQFVITNSYSDNLDDVFTVTEENGNLTGPDAGFVNQESFDFRLRSTSALVDKGGVADWMGTGRRSVVRDLGAGYKLGSVGTYGVSVTRTETGSRRYGAASDIGCCEHCPPPGFLLNIR